MYFATAVIPRCVDLLRLTGKLYWKGGFTHGFVVEFGSEADRDYYVSEDKAHKGFVEWLSEHGYAEEVRVLDYEAGVF